MVFIDIPAQKIKTVAYQAAQSCIVFRFLSYRDFIAELFLQAKLIDEKYSYSRLAVDLGFPASNLVWMIATGRRKMTAKTSSRIGKGLGFNAIELKYLTVLMEYNNCSDGQSREARFTQLIKIKGKKISTAEQKAIFDYYSEWQHPVIREMASLDNFKYDPKWIANKLRVKIRRLEIRRSLELLERLDFIRYDEETQTTSLGQTQILPEQSSESHAMTRYHQKMCEVARDSIAQVDSSEREFNALTVSISSAGADEIRELIQDLCVKIMKIDRKERKSEDVYQVNLQLFPLTRLKKKKVS